MNLGRALRYARHYRNWRELARLRAAGRRPQRVVLRGGRRFEAPPDTNVLRSVSGVFLKRYYTPRGFEIRDGDAVVDVGANLGAFAVYAAGRTRGRVVAVEPHPENLRYLRRNLRANGAERVEVVECALAEADGRALLYSGGSGATHALFPGGADALPDATPLEVATLSLSSLLERQGLERVDLLKLDCEGAEGLVLPATPEACLRRIRRIALEFHDDRSPVDHGALAGRLERSGFRTRLRWDGVSKNGLLYAAR